MFKWQHWFMARSHVNSVWDLVTGDNRHLEVMPELALLVGQRTELALTSP